MPKIARFGVSLEKDLLDRFDRIICRRRYTSRSEAFRDMIRKELIDRQWEKGGEIAGAVTIIYNHHRRDLVNKLTSIQHKYYKMIISTQHIHLDHNNCLEIVAVRGEPQKARELADTLASVKGVKHSTLSMSATGRGIS